MNYLPYEQRYPDFQYRNLLSRILAEGVRVLSQQGEDALMVLGHELRYDLQNGVPIITERDVVSPLKKGGRPQIEQALGELCGFLNGARTLRELENFGCRWWRRWATKEKCQKRGLVTGDLGPGSYGPAWRFFPTSEGKPFDQIQHLIQQIKELPHLRTHLVHPWIPQYLARGQGKQQKVVVVPCHGFFNVIIDTEAKELNLVHIQRSADVPVGLVFNLVQYAALTLMLGHVTGYEPRHYLHYIINAHVFVSQIKDVEEILSATEGRNLPTMFLVASHLEDIFQFRPHHFDILDYHPQLPPRVIPTPV